MKEIDKKSNDLEIVSKVNVNQEKQTKHVGRILPESGHKCFEFNTKLLTVELASFVEEAVRFEDAAKGIISAKRKVIVKEDCKYITALNKKNAIKKLNKIYQVNLA